MLYIVCAYNILINIKTKVVSNIFFRFINTLYILNSHTHKRKKILLKYNYINQQLNIKKIRIYIRCKIFVNYYNL